MSGIFGIFHKEKDFPIQKILDDMSCVMCHRPWHVKDTYYDVDHNLGLGRIGIGIFNQEKQPYISDDNDIVVFLSGELYNQASLQLQLKNRGYSFKNDSDLELVHHLYKEKGANFPAQLNGVFFIIIWNKKKSELIIANDRYGLYPHYYYCNGRCFIISPEMKGLFCDPSLKRELDLMGLSQYMRFQHLLGNRTFFKSIRIFPGGSAAIFNMKNGNFTTNTYWDFSRIEYHPRIGLPEATEEAGRLLKNSVRRLSGDHYHPGVFLSGGLDSRTILSFIHTRPVFSIAYGMRSCRDIYYSRKIARALGSEHHWVELKNGEWVKDHFDFHLDVTEGFHSWIHSHGISALPIARSLFDVTLSGWDGGTIMGHGDCIEPLLTEAVDDTALVTHLFYLYNQKYTWPSITEAEEKFLYTESTGKIVQGTAFDSFFDEFKKHLDLRPDIRAELFFVNNHCMRLTHQMNVFARSHIEVRFPFFDYDLFEFLYSIPAQVRGHKVLYINIIQNQMPKITNIPYDHDEFLPTNKYFKRQIHTALIMFRRRFNKHIFPLFPDRFTLYADYENYLRENLKNWAESILFDERTLDRGIFNPDFISSIWKRHQSRQEIHTIGKIAPIITYEMMLRKILD